MNLCLGALPRAEHIVSAQERYPLFLFPCEGYPLLSISFCTLESLGELLKIPVPGHTPGQLLQKLWDGTQASIFFKSTQVIAGKMRCLAFQW